MSDVYQLQQRVVELEQHAAAQSQTIAELQQHIAEAQAIHGRLQRIAQNTPGMLYQFVLSPDGQMKFTYVSEGCRDMYGLEPSVILADITVVTRLTHPDDQASFQQAVAESAAALTPWRWEGRIVFPDGSQKWVQGFSSPTREADGSTIWDGLLFDRSTQKTQEQALRTAEATIAQQQMNEAILTQQKRVKDSEARLQAILNQLPVIIYELDQHGVFVLSDGPALSRLGLQPGQVVGLSAFDIYQDNPTIVEGLRQTLAGIPQQYASQLGDLHFGNWITPRYNDNNEIIGILGVAFDITEQYHAEAERAALQTQVIEAQQAALRELSTPLIPLADGVLAMPLIGSIDSNRAQQVIESLLTGVAELKAHTAIIDITGVPVVDTQVASALLRAAQAVKLLGANVVLTGIRPEVAQTLVGLGLDLSGITTKGTLQSGVAEALARR